MKKFLVILILSFATSIAFAQPKGVHLYQIKDKRLAHALSMRDTTITRCNDDMCVSLYHIWNQLGSAHMPEDDEVSETYMVSMGEDKGSEMPDDHLYSLGEFLGPKLLEFKQTGKNSFTIIIEHGIYGHRKKAKFLANRNSVILLK